MKKYWDEVSIGEIMNNETTSKAVLKAVEGDSFLTGYFNSFGRKAKHTFAEVEAGSQMAGAIGKDTLIKIKEALDQCQ